MTKDETAEQILALESATRKLNNLITYRRNKMVKEETAEYITEEVLGVRC